MGHVLDAMGKPHIGTYEKFREKYQRLNQKYGKNQYLVPYLMSSHPGCTLDDAIAMAQWINKTGRQPEQVQDFYPTPGTLSTCMYYTGLDPGPCSRFTFPKSSHEKELQRALLQWKRPEKRRLVMEALHKAGRGRPHRLWSPVPAPASAKLPPRPNPPPANAANPPLPPIKGRNPHPPGQGTAPKTPG
ncbi:MAG: DUF3362 domain-containing protein [Evtepia gabavorous]